MQKAIAERRKRYRERLVQQLQNLTPLQIWGMAYQRGYNAAWLRQRRGAA